MFIKQHELTNKTMDIIQCWQELPLGEINVETNVHGNNVILYNVLNY